MDALINNSRNSTPTEMYTSTESHLIHNLFDIWEYTPNVTIHSHALRLFVTYILTVQGLVGNVFTMVAIYRNGLRTTTHILLFNLGFFDCIFSLTHLVSLVINQFKNKIDISIFLVVIFTFRPAVHFLNQFSVSVSYQIVALVSFERFIAVCLPFTVSNIMTHFRVKCILVLIVFYVVVINSLEQINSNDYLVALIFIKNKQYRLSYESFIIFKLIFYIYKFTLVSIVPLVIVIVCTTMTILKLVFKTRLLDAANKKSWKEMRAVRLMLNVCVVYILLVVPVTILQVYKETQFKYGSIYQSVAVFCYQLNASVNFIIYVIHSPKFSRILKNKLSSRK